MNEEFDGVRIDKFLAEIYSGVSRSFFQKLIRSEAILVDGVPVLKNSYPVSRGELVFVEIPEAQSVEILPEDIPLDILYEDMDLLIVNKPKGMVVHPAAGHYSGTLVNAVLFHCADSLSGINGEIRPGIVHRIDKDTTGSLIVCKNDSAHRAIAEQIRAHTANRVYRGIVCGSLPEEEGTVCGEIGRHPVQRKKMAVVPGRGKPAVTHYRVLEHLSAGNVPYTYVEFRLETGRTHQIRVHMAQIGHPLLGDELYGGAKKMCGGKELEGQTLHAMTIGFVHPSSGEYMEFEAPLPDYFKELLKKAGSRDD